jgi:hypothetical protein
MTPETAIWAAALRTTIVFLALFAATSFRAAAQSFAIRAVTEEMDFGDRSYVLETGGVKEPLLLDWPELLDGYCVRKASLKAVGNEQFIIVELTETGLKRLAEMEKTHLGQRVGIVLDNRLMKATTIDGPTAIRTPLEILTTLGAKETAQMVENLNFYDLSEFAGDLLLPFDGTGPYSGPERRAGQAAEMRPYLVPESLPVTARDRIARLHAGMTRQEIEKLCWGPNGFGTMNEYLVNDVRVDGRSLGMRVAFRPQSMPVAIYQDPDRRRLWLLEQRPAPAPEDVVTKVSPPFLTQVVID